MRTLADLLPWIDLLPGHLRSLMLGCATRLPLADMMRDLSTLMGRLPPALEHLELILPKLENPFAISSSTSPPFHFPLALKSLCLSPHLSDQYQPPEHPALLPLFRGLAAHGVTLRSLAISSVTLTTVTITVLTSALGPDLLNLELRITESMETGILERVAARCPNVRTVVLAPPSDRFPLGGYQFGRTLHHFTHLESLTVHRQLNESAEAVAAAIMRVHQPNQ
ncbi:hypothetical protein GGF32_008398 [Allomyces javanicus]|nr:hypothetical protein GGF32_008398 [Allomyces javanicus]